MGKENGQHSEKVRIYFTRQYKSLCSAIVSTLLFIFFPCSLIQRLDGKSKDISKIAADITQNVSLRQGMERKKVIQHIRGFYKTDLSASRHWQELVQQLTHDRWALLIENMLAIDQGCRKGCIPMCTVIERIGCFSGLFGTTRLPTQHRGSWTQLKGQTESADGYRDATSPFPTSTC